MAAQGYTETVGGSSGGDGGLRREVGFFGLLFVSLGSIIGSGWLLGALTAAKTAGPASLISWILAGIFLSILALDHAELGAAYPVAGGTARFPAFAFGGATGFVAGWVGWLQAVTLAPIEVEASLSYLAHISWVGDNVTLIKENGALTGEGILVASVLMLLFVVFNLVGVKFLAESNSIAVIWKTAIPVLTVVVLLALRFHGGNFSAGGGFNPFGWHGIFAALPAGVVFALQGFEQAIQIGGEAKNPQRDISRAVLIAMAIGVTLYIALEVAFIGSLDPSKIAHGWANPVGAGDFGPYATLATAAGATWLAWLLYADAFISPCGTGLIYMGTTSRLSYAMGRERTLPIALSTLRRGVPIWSVALAFVIGEICFLPFPSWQGFVGLVTDATSMMYGFAPIALIALRRKDGDRPRPYRTPIAWFMAPAGFCAANLIIYWAGFVAIWKIEAALGIGLLLFVATVGSKPRDQRPILDLKAFVWVMPWLLGMLVIDYFGRYSGTATPNGGGIRLDIPEWWDLLIVIGWALFIFYWAVSCAMPREKVQAMIAAEEAELAVEEAELEI